MLDSLYDTFLEGLSDPELRQAAIQGTTEETSIYAAFKAMEQAQEQAHKSRVFKEKIEYEEGLVLQRYY